MDYLTAKEYIKGLHGRGIVPGLDAIKQLLNRLGNPQNTIPAIHISGTNGKGSVGAYLSAIIEASGKTCARFVSPCVGEYENTFLINGKGVDKRVISSACEKVKSAAEALESDGIYPTEFIAETALAFTIFSMIKPDYMIIECGMGGKDDATNVIDKPIISVITKISLDHIAFLGDTLTKIAEHKAGIIKNNAPVVSAIQSTDALSVIKTVCKTKNVPLYIADKAQIKDLADNFTTFSIGGSEYQTQLLGTYQPENAALAIKTAEVLGIEKEAITIGVKNANWAYRFERIGKYILDGAHNPDGATALAQSLSAYTTPRDTAFICACFKDKNYEAIAKITAPYASAVYCLTAPAPRGLSKEILCEAFKKHVPICEVLNSIDESINKTKNYKNVVIFGTLSILSEAKDIIERSEENATMQ